MNHTDEGLDRRRVLQRLIAVAGRLALPSQYSYASSPVAGAREEWEIQVSSVSAHTVRLSVLPLNDSGISSIPMDGSLVQASWGVSAATLRRVWRARAVDSGSLAVRVSPDALTFTIENRKAERIQQIAVDRESGVVRSLTGLSPLLGLGEGGSQFDRRGSIDELISGQGGYKPKTHGGRVPIP